MARTPGLSVRLKLTLSYAGFVMLAGALLLTAVWVFLLRGRRANLVVPTPTDFLRALDPRNFGPRAFVPAALMALAFLLIFGLVGGWILAGRMLAPLVRITAAAAAATAGSLSHRIDLEGRRDEFRELADAFDAMLARLERQVAEQQRFTANASHELRTPLAITQAILDVARAEPTPPSAELVDRLSAVNTRAIQLTEALLVLSRADRHLTTDQSVDLSLIAEDAAETLLPLAEKHGVSVQTSGDTAVAVGSPPLLLQLTMNLLHNAIIHNLPDQGNVWVTTRRQAAGALLTIENTGERLPSPVVDTLTEPFQRGTDRRYDDHAGAGLGLAIVQRITQAHGGELSVAGRSDGGLQVTIRLPSPRVGDVGQQSDPRR